MHTERSGDVSHWPELGWLVHNSTGVNWTTSGCLANARGRARTNCKHMVYWPYTRLDGHMATACQVGAHTQPEGGVVAAVEPLWYHQAPRGAL